MQRDFEASDAKVRSPQRSDIRPAQSTARGSMSRRPRRGWISRGVATTGVQARLKIAGEELTKWFAKSDYGSSREAEHAARAWLDSLADSLPSKFACGLRDRVSPSKRDKSLPVGITESRYELRSGNTGSRFQVLWHDGAHTRMKSFTIGLDQVAIEADRRAALRKATTFRRRYEKARKAGLPFKPDGE